MLSGNTSFKYKYKLAGLGNGEFGLKSRTLALIRISSPCLNFRYCLGHGTAMQMKKKGPEEALLD